MMSETDPDATQGPRAGLPFRNRGPQDAVRGEAQTAKEQVNPFFLDADVKPAAVVPINENPREREYIGEAGTDVVTGVSWSPPATSQAADGTAALPGWCVGNTAYGLFLLCAAFLIEAALFAFHCTPIMDIMIDEPGAREWIGVTPTVAAVAGILLVPAMLEALLYIGQLTCCNRRTLRRVRRKAEHVPWRRVSEANTTCWAVKRTFDYLRRPSSAHYVQLLFFFEAKEFVLQALALEQMSRAGIGRVALTLFTTVMLLNGLAPLGMRWIVHRVNRIEDDPVRRRVKASKWLARLLLFDATCDLLYSFFGLAHLIFRYLRIFGEADTNAAELEILNRFQRSIGGGSTSDLKAYMLLSEARATFFGGTSVGDSAVKFLSRGLPLLQAPLRVMSAFAIRQSLSAADAKQAVSVAKAVNAVPTLEDKDQTSSSGSGGGRGRSNTPHDRNETTTSPSITRRRMVMLVRRSAFKGKYNAVPCWAVGSLFVVVVTFCTVVYVRLWSWGECPLPEIRKNCAVRAFPIFRTYDNAEDYGCRSCACNTLFYLNQNCTALALAAARNASAAADLVGDKSFSTVSGCHTPIPGSIGHRHGRYASDVLNASAVILQPATTVMVTACPSDTNLLRTLGMRMGAPTSLQLTTAAEAEAVSVVTASSSNSSSPSFTWTFPPRFGYRRSGGYGEGSELLPLVALTIVGQVRPNNTAISLGNLPTALGLMSTLKGLHLTNLGLTRVPTFIEHVTGLQVLYLTHNNIPFVPSFIGLLTGLKDLEFSHNLLKSSVPPFIGQLTGLEDLGFHNNFFISLVPPSLGHQLTNLKRLSLFDTSITSVPSSLGQLTDLERLRLQGNKIRSVPSSFGRLTNLKELRLDNNTLTTIPASILMAPRSSSSPNLRLNLEANNISFAAMAAVLASISTITTSSSSSSPATANLPSSLALLGNNPACSSNSSLASRVGPWRIKCEPECALGCAETGIGQVKSSLGDGHCDWACETATCGWDGGDCRIYMYNMLKQ